MLTGSPERASNRGGVGKRVSSSFMRQYLENGKKFVHINVNDWRQVAYALSFATLDDLELP